MNTLGLRVAIALFALIVIGLGTLDRQKRVGVARPAPLATSQQVAATEPSLK